MFLAAACAASLNTVANEVCYPSGYKDSNLDHHAPNVACDPNTLSRGGRRRNTAWSITGMMMPVPQMIIAPHFAVKMRTVRTTAAAITPRVITVMAAHGVLRFTAFHASHEGVQEDELVPEPATGAGNVDRVYGELLRHG